ncbi:MAG TPA: ABC transporter permease [Gemmatimonadaceae bacterium]|nr:ABC transporter permease [Gemmatimonadaceae bacterium]
MAWYHEIMSSLGALFGRRRQESEMDEEIAFHIEMEARRLSQAGIEPDEARRRAVRSFGGVERHKDEVRDERGTSWLRDAWSDVRFAARSLGRRPGFTAIATLTLALGIGATTTLFGVVKQVLLTPLPYGHPESLVMVWSAWKGFDRTWLSYDEWEGWRARVHAFEDIGLIADGSATFDGDDPERVRTAQVQANVFPILDVQPIVGRNFTAEEDSPNGPSVVILGYRLWQRRFGGDPSVVGREIRISGRATTVVGVMPAYFRLPLDFGASGRTEAWFPLATDAAQNGALPGPEFPRGGSSHGYDAVARLRPGTTAATANAQLRSLVAELEQWGYMSNVGFHAYTVPMEEQITGRVRPVLLVVFGAVGFVMLIACANVAGLLLVRGESRRRELAVRIALGAGARRLQRLLLAESVVLAAMGAALGVWLAVLGVRLVRATAPSDLPRVADTTIDWSVLAFALVVGVAAALLAGLLPALQATQVAPAAELKEGGRGATSGGARLRWRQALVVAEVALAVVLVTAAGLMIRSVRNLLAIDTGLRADGVLTMRLSTPSTWYPDSASVAAFWNELQRRVAAVPGVEYVGAVRLLPLATDMGDWGLQVEGYTPPPNQGTPGDWQVVTPGYIEAMGLTLREGRRFDARDDMSGALAMIVNRAFVEQYIGDRHALGTRVRINGSDSTRNYTIVGVLDDVHHNSLVGKVKPEFYVTLAQFARAPGNTQRSMSLVIRTDGDPAALAAPVRSTVRKLDARLPISEVRTMSDVVNASISGPRFAMEALGLFGVMALALSAIGIFGIVSQVVASRAHEFGVRAALGATPGELVRLSIRMGVRQALLGLAVGIAIALVLTRTMVSLLQGVRPADPLTLGVVVLVTGLVAVAASMGPARRAGKVDPARVLGSS